MAHGLQVFSASAALRVDVSDRLTRLVHSQVVGATSSGSASVADITTTNAIAIAMCIDAAVRYKCPHEVWITSGTLHWAAMPTPVGSSDDVRQSSLILVFRHK